MPMFHSNALFVGIGPTIVAGGTAVLRRRFSASSAMADIRKYGCNFMNYVGKPLSYILAQPERDDDTDNPLRLAYGNEGPISTSSASRSASTCAWWTTTAPPRRAPR
jgi:fatty-acyl-CoA synthase